MCKQVFKSPLTSYQRIAPAWEPRGATIDQNGKIFDRTDKHNG
jgi:hypothetical protein